MIFFWIKEAFKSIGRAKSSFFLSLISMSISVLLIVASIMIIEISGSLQDTLKKSLTVNLFLKEDLSSREIKRIEEELNDSRFVADVSFISKKQAAEIFVKETGEDFRKLLDYNPLPASFTVTLNPGLVEQESLGDIVSSFNDIEGIDEVVFQHEFAQRLISFLNKLKKYVFILTGVLFLLSLYIVYSTVKLVTNLKYEELETMKLVGAKLSTIKMPIILNGVLIGLFAGIISLSIFILFIYYLDNYIGLQKIFAINVSFYSMLLTGIGPLIGLLVSIISLRNITLKV
ncbi:MAG: permease-like cell division protein FtsX [Ignavibacteriaceae bacterium]